MSSLLVPMMEVEDNDNPSDLNRKRKLSAEKLGLPVPKHKCWDHHQLHPDHSETLDGNKLVGDIINHVLEENRQGNSIDSRMSDHESANDSNSSVVDSHYCTMSVSSESQPQPEVTKTWPSDVASTSSLNWFSGSSTKDPQCSSDSSTGNEPPHLYYDKFQAYDHHEEEDGMLECENHFGYPYQEYYKDGNIPLGDDKELDDVLGLSGSNPHVYVLSSGRWSVDQDAQPRARKPTIDQEFEQYFSSLMLQ